MQVNDTNSASTFYTNKRYFHGVKKVCFVINEILESKNGDTGVSISRILFYVPYFIHVENIIVLSGPAVPICGFWCLKHFLRPLLMVDF